MDTTESEKQYWVYMLLCNNNAYYTGYTPDIQRRFREHMQGTIKSKYTRSFKPLKIAQCWQVENKKQALQIEIFLKNLSRLQKELFVKYPEKLCAYFKTIQVYETNL